MYNNAGIAHSVDTVMTTEFGAFSASIHELISHNLYISISTR